MLTPADIEQKTFSTALRGYDLDEVDDFLDEIVATVRELNDQIEAARAAAATQPDVVPTPVPEPVTSPEPVVQTVDESAIGRALVAAQAAADRLVEDAEGEAARILDEARDEAQEWTAERDAKQREAEAEIAAFASKVAAVRSELAALATEVAGKLDDMDAVIAGESVPEETDSGYGPAEIDPAEDFAEEVEAGIGIVGDEFEAASSAVDESDRPHHVDEVLTGVASDLRLDDSDDDAGLDGAAFEPQESPSPDEEE
jgi:DivIVA domain-containing protein